MCPPHYSVDSYFLIKEKYHKVLEEFHVVDKLTQLEMLEKAHQSGNRAW